MDGINFGDFLNNMDNADGMKNVDWALDEHDDNNINQGDIMPHFSDDDFGTAAQQNHLPQLPPIHPVPALNNSYLGFMGNGAQLPPPALPPAVPAPVTAAQLPVWTDPSLHLWAFQVDQCIQQLQATVGELVEELKTERESNAEKDARIETVEAQVKQLIREQPAEEGGAGEDEESAEEEDLEVEEGAEEEVDEDGDEVEEEDLEAGEDADEEEDEVEEAEEDQSDRASPTSDDDASMGNNAEAEGSAQEEDSGAESDESTAVASPPATKPTTPAQAIKKPALPKQDHTAPVMAAKGIISIEMNRLVDSKSTPGSMVWKLQLTRTLKLEKTTGDVLRIAAINATRTRTFGEAPDDVRFLYKTESAAKDGTFVETKGQELQSWVDDIAKVSADWVVKVYTFLPGQDHYAVP